jgi:hypothetical protein
MILLWPWGVSLLYGWFSLWVKCRAQYFSCGNPCYFCFPCGVLFRCSWLPRWIIHWVRGRQYTVFLSFWLSWPAHIGDRRSSCVFVGVGPSKNPLLLSVGGPRCCPTASLALAAAWPILLRASWLQLWVIPHRIWWWSYFCCSWRLWCWG